MSIRLQRFDFGSLRDFRGPLVAEPEIDELLLQEEPPPPPPAPTFSEEELAAAEATAKQAGFAEGYTAGIAHAAEQANAKQIAAEHAMTQLGTLLTDIHQRYQHLLAREALELGQLVVHVARKVSGTLLDANGANGVTSLISQCLPIILSKPQLIIELHPDAFTQTMDQIEALMQKSGFEGQVQFRTNTAIGIHDAVLDWGTGQATRDTKALWQEVEEVLHATPFTLDDTAEIASTIPRPIL